MNKKKALLALVCAVSLVVATFVGTMAYFTDQDAVTNTFTVGKVGITLDEAKVNTEGKKLNTTDEVANEGDTLADRVKANTYHLIPGQEYVKDPTVTVEKKSEESYIYMTVNVKNFDKLTEALPVKTYSSYYANNIFLIQNLCDWQAVSDWQYKGFKEYYTDSNGKVVSEDTEGAIAWGEYRFAYKETVSGGENGTKLPALFNTIHVPGEDFNNDNIANLENVEIVVKAYAVQTAGFDTLDTAWSATFGDGADFTITATSVNQ